MQICTENDRELVVEILSKSFNDNKSFNSIIKQDNDRIERIKKVFDYYFVTCSKYGRVYISDDRKACAIISFPDQTKTTFKSVIMDIGLLFTLGLNSVKKGFAREATINKVHPKEPFYYLLFIGVDPEYQNQGRGKNLLKELVLDSEGFNRSIYLETYLQKNIALYEKHGFRIYNEINFGFPVFCMKRELIK